MPECSNIQKAFKLSGLPMNRDLIGVLTWVGYSATFACFFKIVAGSEEAGVWSSFDDFEGHSTLLFNTGRILNTDLQNRSDEEVERFLLPFLNEYYGTAYPNFQMGYGVIDFHMDNPGVPLAPTFSNQMVDMILDGFRAKIGPDFEVSLDDQNHPVFTQLPPSYVPVENSFDMEPGNLSPHLTSSSEEEKKEDYSGEPFNDIF